MGSKDNTRSKCGLITGATSGFGYDFSKYFASKRYNQIMVARK